MPTYRLFFISPTPRHVTDKVEFDAANDKAADAKAVRLADGRAMELWQGERVVKVYSHRKS